ncbi:MAG TPA: hypothetical protein VMF13_12370, partial [Luteitalea sp.]|nr:hypothetical protein [Luteitalea sp.]
MQPRQCAGCGAPLPQTDTDGVVTCRFCGMAHDPHHGVRVARLVVGGASDASRSAARVLGIIAAVIGVVVGIVGLGIGVAAWRVSRRPPIATVPSVTRDMPATGITAADLPELPARRLALTAAPPNSELAALDAVQMLPWAISLAQQWESDAAIERIDVERMRPDGTVNGVDDPQAAVRYRFVSPRRTQQLRLEARTNAQAAAVTEFHLGLGTGGTYVQGIEHRAARPGDADRPPHPDVTPLSTLIPRLAERDAYR